MTTKTTKTASQKGGLFDSIAALAGEITGEKQAAAKPVAKTAGKPGVKTAAPLPSDPGGYQGASTHPSADADNHGEPEQTGARAAENESDVKEDQPVGVDSAPDNTPGDQDSVQLNIGTTQSATGEDPSVEDDFKGNKEDPGTTSPATVEDGEKYGSLTVKQAYAKAVPLANEILADLANGFGSRLQKTAQPAQRPAPVAQPKPVPKTAAAAKPAAQAPAAQPAVDPKLLKSATAGAAPQYLPGYELAAALSMSKEAAEASVKKVIIDTVKEAQDDADRFGTFYKSFENRVKTSSDPASGAAEGEDHSGKDDSSSGAGDSPSGGGPDHSKPHDKDGGGGGADDGGANGASLGDIVSGGDNNGPMGGDPSQDQALQQLAAALDELGIPLDALAAAAPSGGGGGGMGGGMPPMGGDPSGGMGGAPPMGGDPTGGMGGGMPPAPPMGAGPGGPPGMEVAAAARNYTERVKLAHAVQNLKRSGRYQFKAAATPQERELRNIMRGYVAELLGGR